MRKLLILCLLFCYYGFSPAQIPNPGFESWTSNTVYIPDGWKSYGRVSQITPGNNGNYAVRIERNSLNPAEPGALVYGIPANNKFVGGVPFADRPDSLVASLKYDVAAGDSAWMFLVFKKNGITVSSNVYYVTGTHTVDYSRMSFKINYSSQLVPDSMVIGIISSIPDNINGFGYLVIDDIKFTGTSLPVPNGDLELWNPKFEEEPAGWHTSNQAITYNPNVSKTTSSYTGSYGIRIENKYSPVGLIAGYAMTASGGPGGLLPGFAVSKRDTVFSGAYMFEPQAGDTATISVFMFSNGVMVGSGVLTETNTMGSYSEFSIPIIYNGNFQGVPDSATILLMASLAGSSPHGNSVLYVDNLEMDGLVTGVKEDGFGGFSVYPNPCMGRGSIDYVHSGGNVKIRLCDQFGRELMLLKNEWQEAGVQRLSFDLPGVKSGVYYLLVEAGDRKRVVKVVLLKG